jgi:hypothetical protein
MEGEMCTEGETEGGREGESASVRGGKHAEREIWIERASSKIHIRTL